MKKMKIDSKHLFAILAFLLSAVVIFCGVQIWQEYSSRQKDIDTFSELAELAEIKEPDEPKETAEPETHGDDIDVEVDADTQEEQETTAPTLRHDIPLLISQNSDCIGWISMLACNPYHRQRVGTVTVDCTTSFAGSAQSRTLGNRATLPKAWRQEQFALYAKVRLKRVPSAKGELYLFTDRCYLSSWREKANLPTEKILQQKRKYIYLIDSYIKYVALLFEQHTIKENSSMLFITRI